MGTRQTCTHTSRRTLRFHVRHRWLALGLGGALVLSACKADLQDGGGSNSGDSDSSSGDPAESGGAQLPTCDPDEVSPGLPLRRLSRLQAQHTIDDLIAYSLPDSAADIRAELSGVLATFPVDQARGPDAHVAAFSRVDQDVDQSHVDALYNIGLAIGEAFTTGERWGSLVGACATDDDPANDDACFDDFVSSFGKVVLRKPLSEEDGRFYRESFGASPLVREDYKEVIALLLNAPQAFYFVEHGSDETGEVSPLSAFELASRLSYHFWQSAPDAELLRAAEDGSLLEDDVYEAQVRRIYNDERTARSLREFYGEWLHQSHIDALDSRSALPAFQAFAGDDLPGSDTLHHMEEELQAMGLYYAHSTSGSFDDWFTSRESFAKTDDLAQIYGVPTWDEESEPPTFPDPERAGLITRAALLANASGRTRPVMKGLFIRQGLLCADVPLPPPDVMAGEPEAASGATTRATLEALTESPGTPCTGCHSRFINPLGYTTEGFDALGRTREEELFFDPETGELTGSEPIDSTTEPRVLLADETETSGPSEVNELILDTGLAQACMSRVYFRYTFGRVEDLTRDGCAITEVSDALNDGASLSESLQKIALSPAFRTHNFEN